MTKKWEAEELDGCDIDFNIDPTPDSDLPPLEAEENTDG